jgi:hypothetical protein
MEVYEIDPLADSRWDDLLERHPGASIFHTRAWLLALQRTYKYEPLALTTSATGDPLRDGLPLCKISNWFGGRRLVSLPFSDHCAPLVETSEQLSRLLRHLQEKKVREGLRSIQLRPIEEIAADGWTSSQNGYFLHRLDLRTGLQEIFQGFHESCVRKKIRRAVREGLSCLEGRSEALIKAFYRLLVMTRRRHGVPPQPIQWFYNLVSCLGDRVSIRLALKDDQPIAGILTLCYKQVLTYKYGCSSSLNGMGGMQLLFWSAIQAAKNSRLSTFDMGRSDCDAAGLIAFKDRWGATKVSLRYVQHPQLPSRSSLRPSGAGIRKYVCSHAPCGVLSATGRVLYKYMG